jgi:hypothetical protein
MRFLLTLCFLGFTPLLVGCDTPQDDSVPVHGKLTNNGQPLVVKGRDIGLGWVELHFYRMHDDGTIDKDPADAGVEESGEFTVRGRDGGGLPPGKYKITVRQLDPGPDNDKLSGRFNLENTPLVREVVEGEEIIIDLARPKG